nr:retrovirus-related Pol polyprotein from transposon TNT 1-94 [Tanacetum cinerariifolium]GEZ10176.1 retrovirus-related Pol polyprotein from transposon TNT 1-94 [Tanacetum cinerariifolium]
MTIAEDELNVGKTDVRPGQWVEITMKKVQILLSMNDGDEKKHVLNYTNVDLHYVEDHRKNLHSKFNSLKQELSLCGRRIQKETTSSKDDVFTKAENSPPETSPNVTSNTKPPQSLIRPNRSLKRNHRLNVKKKAQTTTPSIPNPRSEKKAYSSIEQLLVTLMKEVKGVKEQIKPSCDNSPSIS